MDKKRTHTILIVFTLVITALIFRVFYLQFFMGKKYSEAASSQRMFNSEIEKPRGNVSDRNFINFTNRSKKIEVALMPFFLRGKDEELRKVCSLLGLDFYEIKNEIDVKREPILIDTDDVVKKSIMQLGIHGISYINSLSRYDRNTVAKHVLGYLNRADHIGQAGLEKFYEKELRVDKKSTISAVTDAKNNLLQGVGYRITASENKQVRFDIKLTLDFHIQKIVESIMEKNRIKGAVVVEEISTGDIIAMASKPDFDQNNVELYLESQDNALFNRAVASYSLGSIFKIISVASALEAGQSVSHYYNCPGYIQIGDKEYKCSSYSRGGHGEVGISEAFAASCNPYFIDMGINTGHKKLIEMAKNFGLGDISGIKSQGVTESAGNLPDISKYFSSGDVANISIGQGEIMATPLQVADIIATVANGGIKNQVNIVDSIVSEDGIKIRNIRRTSGTRIISKKTADQIKELMEEVTTSEWGTGREANLEQYGGAAGKTGSAETGQYLNGEQVVHAWFAGYFPRSIPKYAIAVFVEGGKAGGRVAAPIFSEIAEEIMKKGY